MMITIHGLPTPTKYADLKILIKQKCNITDFILDSLMSDADGLKKVRVGLADDSEGNHLIKCLDGYRLTGHVLRLLPVAKSSQINAPQANTYEMRDGYQQRNDYPNQMHDRGGRQMEAHPGTWTSNNQWNPNQLTPSQGTGNYSYQQQPRNSAYGHPISQPVKQQFEQREAIPSGHRPQQNPAYNYSQKSNLINLGPHRITQPAVLREGPEVPGRPIQGNRYPPQQNYDMSDKPITIMKDNFQGPAPYNVHPGHEPAQANYQPSTQPTPWSTQHQPKQFEKPIQPPFEKKLYDDRKYPMIQVKPGIEMSKIETYKSYEKNRDFSPPSRVERYRKNMSQERSVSSPGRPIGNSGQIYTDRRSPDRRISPSGRQFFLEGRSSIRGRRVSPGQVRRVSPGPGRRVSPIPGRRVSPVPGRRVSPGPARRASPIPGRRVSPGQVRRVSPGPGRRVSPGPGRRVSPIPGRRVSPVPGRRVSPVPGRGMSSERRISPSSRHVQGRRFSPPGRQIPPDRMSPGRKVSPPRKFSPSLRRISPPRKDEYVRGRISPPSHSPIERRIPSHPSASGDRESMRGMRQESPRRQVMRYSPSRHHADKSMDFQDTRPNVKNVRPAYEPPSQASNEAKYSGAYRPNVRVDAQYPARIQDQRWQDKDPSRKVVSEDRRDLGRLQKFDIPRGSEQTRPVEQETRSRSDNRSSRSPRRDRSPTRDRYKRHSRSPRSPRRSWALEKRRSTDAHEPPPPPIWPGQDNKHIDYHQNRSKFTDRENEKISLMWETTHDKKRDDFIRQRNADREHYEEEMRRRQRDGKWKPLPQTSPIDGPSRYDDDDRIHRVEKFSRKNFEERHNFDSHEDDIRKQSADRRDEELSRQEFDSHTSRFKPDFEMKEEPIHKSEKFSGLEEKKKAILKKQEQLQKEIDEVYKRAIDFSKKAELYKKGELKRSYDDSRRHEDTDSEDSDNYYKEYSHKERKEYLKGHFAKDEDKDYEDSSHEIDRARKSSPAKSKRNTAIKQIADKIMSKYGSHLPSGLKSRVLTELQLSVSKILTKMFGKGDVAFIELVIKFNSTHTPEDEEKIFDAVMSSFPTHYRRAKRSAKDDSNIPAKSSKLSGLDLNKDEQPSVSEPMKSTGSVVRKPVIKKKLLKRTIENPDNTEINAKKQKLEEEKPKEKKESVEEVLKQEEQTDGHFELNEVMTQVLEDELQAIMIKVWQTLPDNPPSEVERFVTERLKNETSDELRNVLGLNVTKRLLNVFNPLYVKIRFSCRPESGCLTEFINKYNIKNFKRVDKHRHLFAARMLSIADFDNICTRNIRCGSAKIIVTPCYKFMHCPPNLITTFANNNDEGKAEKGESTPGKVTNTEKDIEKIETNVSPVIITKEQSDAKENVDTEICKPETYVAMKPKTVTKEPVQTETVLKVNQNKEINPVEGNRDNESKESESKINVVKRVIERVKEIEEVITQNKEKQPASTEVKVAKPTTQNQVKKEEESKQVVVAEKFNADVVKKENEDVAAKLAKPTITNQGNEESEQVTAQKLKPNAVKKETKNINSINKVAKPTIPNRIKRAIVARKHVTDTEMFMEDIEGIDSERFDENDEMDDEEILALMSEGVIVDECSGSDED